MKPIQITFTIKKEDYIKFNVWYSWLSPDRRNYRILLYTLITVGYFGIYFYQNWPIIINWRNSFMIILGMGLLVVFPWLTQRSLKKQAADVFDKRLSSQILENTIKFTENEVIMSNEQGRNKVKLEKVYDIQTFEDLLLVYLQPKSAVIIAAHNFNSIEDFDAFKTEALHRFRKAKKI